MTREELIESILDKALRTVSGERKATNVRVRDAVKTSQKVRIARRVADAHNDWKQSQIGR